MLPVMSAVHLKMNVAVITLPKPKNSIHIDVAHHNQHVEVAHHNAHIDVPHHNTHVEVAHHNAHVEVAHIDVNHNNTHINIHIVVAHPDVRIHLTVRLIANANLQDLPLSHLLDQAHIRAYHSIAHLDPPPDPHLKEDPHLEEDPQHEVILLF